MSFTIQLSILRNKLKNMRISNFKEFKGFCLVGLSALLLNSCYNEPQFLGNNLVPNDDKHAVKTDTLFELSAYTLKEDSLNTYLYSTGMLGYVNSEIFGSTKGSFVGRYLPAKTTEGYGGATAKPDSLFFNFTPSSFYGDTSRVLTIKVHELTDTLVLWEPKNGLKSIEGHYNPTPFITTTFTGGMKNIRIPIDTSFARLLMDSSALANPKEFYTKLKGFYITCDDLPGDGGIMYIFPVTSTYLSLYYHYNKIVDGKDSTFKKTKVFNYTSSRFFQYINDYSKSNPLKSIKYLNDSTIQDSVFYVQSLGGVYGKISLDGVTSWMDSLPLALHRAELVVGKYTPETTTPDSVLRELSLGYKVENKWVLSQYGNKYIYYGGLKLYTQEYSFDITTHLQRVLEGEIKDRNLYIFPNTSVGISRVVLQSGSNISKKMKLRLTYTKLK